jgi:hypothetical protein
MGVGDGGEGAMGTGYPKWLKTAACCADAVAHQSWCNPTTWLEWLRRVSLLLFPAAFTAGVFGSGRFAQRHRLQSY